MIWSTIIPSIISVISIFISFWLGSLKQIKIYKYKQSEKYTKIYIFPISIYNKHL